MGHSSLVVVSYPDAEPQFLALIEQIRNQYRGLRHSLLPPHVTFVFPTNCLQQSKMLSHMKGQLPGFGEIPFVLRSSLLVKDDPSDNFYVLLVPDEGFSRIVKLHDRLYTGPLAAALRLDIPFIPHVTVGYSEDVRLCKAAVDDLNALDFEIRGTISSLDVISKADSRYETIERLHLASRIG